VARVVSYIRFFVERRRFVSLFGEQILVYVHLLALVYAILVLNYGVSGVALSPWASVAATALFVFAHCMGLAGAVSAHLSVAQTDYLSYLGFTDRQVRSLARVIVLPASLVGSLFVFLALTQGMSLIYRLSAFVASFIVGELLCPLSLWSRKHLRIRHAVRRQKTARNSSLISAFQGPYHAFFQKDLRELRTLNGIPSIIFLMVLGLGVMLFSRIGQNWMGFTVCFSIALFFVAGTLPLTFFEYEVKSYRVYYARQLRLRDRQIVSYKLPLQVFIVLFFACMLVVYDGLMHGFVAHYLLTALGVAVYCIVLCVSLCWWCARRLKKGKDFNSLYQMASLALFAIPGAMIVYALILIFKMRSERSLRMEGSRHA
jgi:hypothetical protein